MDNPIANEIEVSLVSEEEARREKSRSDAGLPPLPNDTIREGVAIIPENDSANLERVEVAQDLAEVSAIRYREATIEQQNIVPDDDEEEDEDEEIMDPDHPLLERVQKAIFEQLSKHIQKTTLIVREKEEEALKETKRRENVGVELYTLQQHLARLQSTFEGAEENYGIIRSLREDAERALKHSKTDYEKEKEKLSQHSNNLEQHQTELEKIALNLKQVDLYNDELRSKILVAKRTTLKSEKDIIQQEIEKKRQDFFIDHLTEQLRKLQEKRATYDSQLAVQQRETQAAISTLRDAATEMEAIQFEKRQLLNQWKSSLIGLKKRDEMIAEIEGAIQKNNETLSVMHSEIAGYKRNSRKSQEDGENLTSVLNKLEFEIDYVKRQIGNRAEDKEKLSDSYSIFNKSLSQTEGESSICLQERTAIQAEINAIQKAHIQTTSIVQKLDDDIAEKLKTQSSVSKGAQSSMRSGNKLRHLIHEKESSAANYQNEISVIQLEVLGAENRIESMKNLLAKIVNDITDKNELIAKYEQEIRQNNDSLSKRASEMDSLNKKYDQMTSGSVDSHMGPLEAVIHNLGKSIQLKETECLQLQHYWLKAQNELVTISKKAVEYTDEIQNLRMRLTVLNRKKMVVNNAFETEEKQIREHNRNIRQLQNEMIKINTILSKQSNIFEKLEETNLEMEHKFRHKLKDAELESITLEGQLEKLKEEKEEALIGLLESERQMMLWEKKIQLAKETQSALDPNVGATEIKEMSLEIHRMTLRYASMLKLQEKMIAEMEKSVYRRESISTKGKSKGKGVGQLSLQKHITDLSKKIQQAVLDIKGCEQDIVDLEQSFEVMKEQIEESSESSINMDTRSLELDIKVETLSAKKRMYGNATLVYQKLHRRYADFGDKKYQPAQSDPTSRLGDIFKSQSKLNKIKELIQMVQKEADEKPKMILEQHTWFIDTTTSELAAL